MFTTEHDISPQGDVDLRLCNPDLQMRCSYFKVFYDDDANFLNDKITKDYMSSVQTFKAKVAIVQVGPVIDIFPPIHSTCTAHALSHRLLLDYNRLGIEWVTMTEKATRKTLSK